MHIVEPTIQIPQLPLVRHILVNLHLPIQIVLHQARDLCAALHAAERGPAPDAAGDELGKLTLLGTFKQCDGDRPDSLAVGESFNECEVYVAPPGQAAVDVEFSFYVDLKKTEVTWQQG